MILFLGFGEEFITQLIIFICKII